MLLWTASALAEDGCASCSCSAGGAMLSMPSYDPVAGLPVTAAGTITISCQMTAGAAASVAFQIGLSKGTSATYAPRTMTGPGGATLNYNLYSDAAMTAIWGDGSGGAGVVTQSAALPIADASVNVPVNIYARIPGAQNVPVGGYGDTVVMTLQF